MARSIPRLHPIKDSFALTIILLKFPPAINCVVLLLYAISESSKAIASRLLAKVFRFNYEKNINGETKDIVEFYNLLDNDYQETSQEKKVGYLVLFSYIINSSGLPLMINFLISILLYYCSPNLLNLVKLLAKALISCNLFGIHGTRALITCMIMSCIIILSNFSYNVLVTRFSTTPASNVFMESILTLNSLDTQLKTLVSAFTISLGSSGIQIPYVLKNFFSSFWNFLNYSLSIHVILLEFSPSFRNINYLKTYMALLDQLSKISPEYISNNEEILDTINEEKASKTVKGETLAIYISNELADSKLNSQVHHIEEADNFYESPAAFPDCPESSQEIIMSNPLSSSLNVVISNLETFFKLPSDSRTKPKTKRFSSRHQPLWSVVAALFAMRSRPDIYSGEISISEALNDSKYHNSLVSLEETKYNFPHFPDNKFPVKCFVDYIGQTSIAFQIIRLTKFKQKLEPTRDFDTVVLVNGVEWNTHIYNEQYIVIIGLTPSSTYDIEIFAITSIGKFYHESLVARYIISTNNDDNSTKAASKIDSPINTLKRSVATTNNIVARERLQLKKLKKDCNKTISDLTREIDSLNKKIRDSDKNDEKIWKKVAAFKAESKRLEDIIVKKNSKLRDLQAKDSDLDDLYQEKKVKFDKQHSIFQTFQLEHLHEIDQLEDLKQQELKNLNSIKRKHDRLNSKLEKTQSGIEKSNKLIDTLVENNVRERRAERDKRTKKRNVLINEFRKEIRKVEEMTKVYQERIQKLEDGTLG